MGTSHSCLIFSVVRNWPPAVSFLIFHNGGQTVTLCHENRHMRDRAQRDGCCCPCETPTTMDTSSLEVPLPLRLHRRVSLTPTPHTAASGLLLGGDTFHREECRPTLEKRTQAQGLLRSGDQLHPRGSWTPAGREQEWARPVGGPEAPEGQGAGFREGTLCGGPFQGQPGPAKGNEQNQRSKGCLLWAAEPSRRRGKHWLRSL